MVHPVQSVIESLNAAGRCPRLHVNADFDGVECPDFVREKWRERLVIDLDPSYPLDLQFADEGLEVNLSFGGHVSRCVFPWGAIYVVADRNTGRGVVLDQNVPESVRQAQKARPTPERAPDPAPEPAETPGPTAVTSQPDANVASADETSDEDAAPAEDGAEVDESQVKQRRAAFRVIDGGN